VKALLLIQGHEVAAARYRVLQYLPGLRERGVEGEARRFPHRLRDLAGVLAEARRSQAVLIQRKQLTAIPHRLLRAASRRLVYDFDDSLWVRSSKHADSRSLTRRIRFRRMVTAADEVVAGNSFLAERASRLNPRVRVIPTPVDTGLYPLRPEEHDPARVTVGWIGAHASVHYLARLREPLEEAHRRDPRIRLKVVCSAFPEMGLPVDQVVWRQESEVDEIRSMDVGIMPLTEDEWSRGKCGLKILQYLAAGVPVVATPVGINADIIEDGRTGFGARAPGEWVERLLLLASDPALRRRLGLAGREVVEARYSLRVCLPLLEEVLRGE
jgi:glycosyltransferase involved in cell wall biosynthesis